MGRALYGLGGRCLLTLTETQGRGQLVSQDAGWTVKRFERS